MAHGLTFRNLPKPTNPLSFWKTAAGLGEDSDLGQEPDPHGTQYHFWLLVLLTDHNHAFEDVTVPIGLQGITEGGTIRIEEGCWVGFGVAVVCSQGELVIGKHSVIGANSLINRSVPPYSIVSGNPARIVKQFDPEKGTWELGGRIPMGQSQGAECVRR